MKESIKRLKDCFKVVGEEMIKIWKDIKRHIENISELIDEMNKEDKHEYNWFVPMKILKNHQVINKRPLIINTRNRL